MAVSRGEDSGLGSDPFNLMPIIEYHQRVKKMRLRRRVERHEQNNTRANASESMGAQVNAFGKRGVQEDEEVENQREGRKRLVDNLVFFSSSAEVDRGQPRCMQ